MPDRLIGVVDGEGGAIRTKQGGGPAACRRSGGREGKSR